MPDGNPTVKNYLCVFFILSPYTENTRKGFKHLRRLRRKYLSIFGEYAENIYAQMENMANQCYLRYTKSSPYARKVFKHIRGIRGKDLCVHGDDAKRLLAYSPNTPRRHKSVYISVNNTNLNFLKQYTGQIKPKNHLTLLSL